MEITIKDRDKEIIFIFIAAVAIGLIVSGAMVTGYKMGATNERVYWQNKINTTCFCIDPLPVENIKIKNKINFSIT